MVARLALDYIALDYSFCYGVFLKTCWQIWSRALIERFLSDADDWLVSDGRLKSVADELEETCCVGVSCLFFV